MNLLLTLTLCLTFCLTLTITDAFLLPREMDLGITEEKKSAMDKKELMTKLPNLQKFVDLLVSLMKKSKPVSENIETGPFTIRAWLETKRSL